MGKHKVPVRAVVIDDELWAWAALEAERRGLAGRAELIRALLQQARGGSGSVCTPAVPTKSVHTPSVPAAHVRQATAPPESSRFSIPMPAGADPEKWAALLARLEKRPPFQDQRIVIEGEPYRLRLADVKCWVSDVEALDRWCTGEIEELPNPVYARTRI